MHLWQHARGSHICRRRNGPPRVGKCLQDTPVAELAFGTVLHRVEGTYAQFAAFREHHHRLELLAATFQREAASPVLPLTPRTHILIENSCLQGEAGCELAIISVIRLAGSAWLEGSRVPGPIGSR